MSSQESSKPLSQESSTISSMASTPVKKRKKRSKITKSPTVLKYGYYLGTVRQTNDGKWVVTTFDMPKSVVKVLEDARGCHLLFNTMLETKADELLKELPGFFQKINNRVCDKSRFEKLRHVQFTTQAYAGEHKYESNNLSIASFVSMSKETENEILKGQQQAEVDKTLKQADQFRSKITSNLGKLYNIDDHKMKQCIKKFRVYADSHCRFKPGRNVRSRR